MLQGHRCGLRRVDVMFRHFGSTLGEDCLYEIVQAAVDVRFPNNAEVPQAISYVRFPHAEVPQASSFVRYHNAEVPQASSFVRYHNAEVPEALCG